MLRYIFKSIALILIFINSAWVYANTLENPWIFSVIVGVSQNTANHYGGESNTQQLITDQLVLVNSKFSSPGIFDAEIVFALDSLYFFEGDVMEEVFKPFSDFDYKVIYDGFPTQGGGWYGYPYNTIHHAWSVHDWGGTFESYATDGLTHEFGHSRGAIDLYAIEVNAQNNSVNNEAYNEAVSIMNYPYDVDEWDYHSYNIINRNRDQPLTNTNYIRYSFPPEIKLLLLDINEMPVKNHRIRLYPVQWYDYSVYSFKYTDYETDENGILLFQENPFNPFSNNPWHVEHPNFLVTSELNNELGYTWLPLTLVQNQFFRNPELPYIDTIRFSSEAISVPTSQTTPFSLNQNFPNPFNKHTNISFFVPQRSNVKITLYNSFGKTIKVLTNVQYSEGEYNLTLNRDELPSGIYLYTLESQELRLVHKMVITE